MSFKPEHGNETLVDLIERKLAAVGSAPFELQRSGGKARVAFVGLDGNQHTLCSFPKNFGRDRATLVWLLLHNLPLILQALRALPERPK